MSDCLQQTNNQPTKSNRCKESNPERFRVSHENVYKTKTDSRPRKQTCGCQVGGGRGRMERELGISKLMYIICRMDRQVLIYALVYTICSISDLLHSVQQTVSLAWCSVMT